MLEIRPICENCGKSLPNESTEAMICTFECTFCVECVTSVLENVCPNCGGGFEKRPSRPKEKLLKYPTKMEEYRKPIEMASFGILKEEKKHILSHER
jgi:uncharacterized protein